MTALRDQRIGRLLAARGCRAITQAEKGGTPIDNLVRMAEWRNRYALVPIEDQIRDLRITNIESPQDVCGALPACAGNGGMASRMNVTGTNTDTEPRGIAAENSEEV